MCVRIVDIQHPNLKCITCTWKTTTPTVRPFTNSMTRGISSSQMQILPACYFKLIPNNSDLGHLKKKTTENPQYFFHLGINSKCNSKISLTTTENNQSGIWTQLQQTSFIKNQSNHWILYAMIRVNVVCNQFNTFFVNFLRFYQTII